MLDVERKGGCIPFILFCPFIRVFLDGLNIERIAFFTFSVLVAGASEIRNISLTLFENFVFRTLRLSFLRFF
jgi:hypothetical protein